MRRVFTVLAILAALASRPAPAECGPPEAEGRAGGNAASAPDLFAQVLAGAGLDSRSLGFRGNGTWNRYPNAPYKLPFFDDLLAEPTSTYEFVRTLGNVVEDWLTPERLREPDPKKATALFRLGVALGTERRIGGFRGPFGDQFGANLDPKPAEKEPLVEALLAIRKESSDIERTRVMLRKDAAGIPAALHLPLARLLLNLTSAREWIDRGLRDVPQAMREQVFALLPRLAESDGDGRQYSSVIDDVAKRIDEHSLAYGCLRALQATQDARRELGELRPRDGWPPFAFGWLSRLGHVGIGSEDGAVTSDTPMPESRSELEFDPTPNGSFLVVAFERADLPRVTTVHPGDRGVSTETVPLSVAIFLEGLDRFGVFQGGLLLGDPGVPSALARGVLGCGIVYVATDQATEYVELGWGLGAGLFGMGALVDEGGDDTYDCDSMGQGAGMFGVGLLLDAAGNDTYVLRKGDGQGFGGPNGIGVLADRSGNDSYYAEPDAKKAGRADYHSDNKVAVSNAQGVGSGRRGDLTDGHAWAGGLGALIDVDGDDKYRAGNFSQGCGYWFGTGAIYDGGGNDEYRSVYFTQASGAHFAVGTIVDEGGDDVHVLEENAGAGFGFGWDVVNAILHDRAGNDRYEAKIISVGCANVRSNGWLLDEGGDDVYVLDEGAVGFGGVDDRPAYSVPDRYAPFAFHIPQLGLLIDAGGSDRYLRRPKAGGDPVPDDQAKDGARWGKDWPGRPGAPNVARGLDAASGRIGFLDPWPRRSP